MIIPKKFTLAGIEVTVILDDQLMINEKMYGKSDYQRQEIRIDPTAAPKQTVEQAFIHELVHWVLYIQNRHDLRNDEDFVDAFAHLLYQSLKTIIPLTEANSGIKVEGPEEVQGA